MRFHRMGHYGGGSREPEKSKLVMPWLLKMLIDGVILHRNSGLLLIIPFVTVACLVGRTEHDTGQDTDSRPLVRLRRGKKPDH